MLNVIIYGSKGCFGPINHGPCSLINNKTIEQRSKENFPSLLHVQFFESDNMSLVSQTTKPLIADANLVLNHMPFLKVE